MSAGPGSIAKLECDSTRWGLFMHAGDEGSTRTPWSVSAWDVATTITVLIRDGRLHPGDIISGGFLRHDLQATHDEFAEGVARLVDVGLVTARPGQSISVVAQPIGYLLPSTAVLARLWSVAADAGQRDWSPTTRAEFLHVCAPILEKRFVYTHRKAVIPVDALKAVFDFFAMRGGNPLLASTADLPLAFILPLLRRTREPLDLSRLAHAVSFIASGVDDSDVDCVQKGIDLIVQEVRLLSRYLDEPRSLETAQVES